MSLPPMTSLPSGCRLTLKHPTETGSSTRPPVPKVPSSVPSALKRAMPHWSMMGPLVATPPTSTILPSGCSTSLRPKLLPVVPGKRVVTTPLLPKSWSRAPLASSRITRKSYPRPLDTLVRPPTTILPSGWIATVVPRSLRLSTVESANCATPLVPKVVSSRPRARQACDEDVLVFGRGVLRRPHDDDTPGSIDRRTSDIYGLQPGIQCDDTIRPERCVRSTGARELRDKGYRPSTALAQAGHEERAVTFDEKPG